MNRPPSGFALPCVVDEVYDGDTVTVSVRLPARIRLIDCWADEIRTTDAAEKARGLAARDYLKGIAEGKRGLLVIPADDAGRVGDVLSFERILGYVWLDDGDERDLSTRMRESGYATQSKAEVKP